MKKGHLSNDASARLIEKVLHPGLQHILLGHLSKENNFPELAYQTVSYELEQNPVWKKDGYRVVSGRPYGADKTVDDTIIMK